MRYVVALFPSPFGSPLTATTTTYSVSKHELSVFPPAGSFVDDKKGKNTGLLGFPPGRCTFREKENTPAPFLPFCRQRVLGMGFETVLFWVPEDLACAFCPPLPISSL